MKKLNFILSISLYVATCFPPLGGQRGACQTIGSDTTIQAFNLLPQINSLQDTTVTVVFPPSNYKYEKVLLHYSLNQPPAGWDPWDRIAYIRVFTATDTFEIGRVMTPYSKACSWSMDVTDYRPLLTDTAKINSFILFWASNNKGYLVSISFEFIGGNPEKEAYKIQNLWGNDAINRWEYGNDNNPISNYLAPQTVMVDALADSVKIKVTATGHGQGNTGNAAEFSDKTHSVVVNGNIISHQLWRSNCGQNPCSPQSGTWQYNRAGWCPGADVLPWDVDITSLITLGNSSTIEYQIQQYTNYCSPSYPSCITGQTCADCNFNSNGHTMPWYLMQSQIIFYKNIYPAGQSEIADLQPEIFIYPNPNGGTFTIELPSPVFRPPYSIKIYDAQGRTVFEETSGKKTIQVNFSDYSPGIYLVNVQTEIKIIMKKIIYQ